MFIKLKSKISDYLDFSSEWNKSKKIIFFLIQFFFFLVSFSTMALSGRYPFNYLNIAFYFILIFSITLFVFLYGVFRFDIYFLFLFLFNIFMLVSALFTNFRNFNFTTILVTTTSFFIYQFLVNVNDGARKALFFSLFGGGLLFSLYFFIVYINVIFSFDFSVRLGGYFDNVNEMAKYFVFLSLFSLYLVMFKKRYGYFILFLIFSIFLVWTGSRSNLLTLVLLILFLVYLKFPKGRKKYFIVSLFFLTVLGILILQLNFMSEMKLRLYNSIITLFNLGGTIGAIDYSTQFRKIALIEAFELFLQRPLFGYGFRGTNLYSFLRISAHNNFLALLGNFGIFTFLSFQFLLLKPIAAFLNKKMKNNDISILATVLVLYVFFFQFFLINYYTKIEFLIIPFAYINCINRNLFFNISFSKHQ